MKTTKIIAIATICISVFAFTTTFATSHTDFVTVWKTTTANETITIPTNSNYTYDYNVDCGVNASTRNLTNQTGSAVCTYPTIGDDHEIRISGTFPAIYFNETGDRLKITDITQWGTGQWRSFASAFNGTSNMKVNATDAPNLTATNISMRKMFISAPLANPDVSDWDTSKVTDMSLMFSNAFAVTPNTTDWNTSNVTNMSSMFSSASLANPDVSRWDVRKVTNMSNMFRLASRANPDVSGWQTDKLSNIANVLYFVDGADSDVGGWNVSGVTSAGEAFDLTQINYDKLLAGWSIQDLQSGVTLGTRGLKYCNTVARTAMIAKGWNFTQDSPSSSPCPTNTAPTATGLPEKIDFVADTDIDIDLSDAVFADTEDDILTLNLAVAAGTLTATATDNITVIGSGTAALELSGTPTNLHTYLDTASAIQYNSSEQSIVTVQLRDARSAVTLSGITIIDDTTITTIGLPETSIVIGQSGAFDLSTTTLYGPNPNAVTLTLSADTGTWNATSTGGVVATTSGSILSLAGALADINTYLDDSTRIQYSPTVSSSVVTVTASDGTYDVTLGTVTVDVFAESDAFVTTWTTTAADTITIPVYPAAGITGVAPYTAADFQYHVDCGNSQPILVNQTGNTDCVYPSADTYTVRIVGSFPGIYLNADDRDKLTTIEQWGTIAWRSMYNAFIRASNVTISASAGAPDLSETTTLRGMFAYNTALTNQDLSGWDTSTITNMDFVFANSTADLDLSGWDVSAVTTADGMFREAGLSTANYDKLLAAWSAQTLQTGVAFGVQGVKYCDANARSKLTSAPNNWIITDGGAETESECPNVANLDIDGNGSVQASTDGILIARYIAAVRGASLIAGAVAGNASDDRNEVDEIEAYLEMLIPADPSADKPLDIDGNGTVQASTDGILIARYIAAVRGASLIAGAVAGGASEDRNEASEIEAYLLTLDI